MASMLMFGMSAIIFWTSVAIVSLCVNPLFVCLIGSRQVWFVPKIRFPPATWIVDFVWLVWLRSCPESIRDFVTKGLVQPVSEAMRNDSPDAVVMVQMSSRPFPPLVICTLLFLYSSLIFSVF